MVFILASLSVLIGVVVGGIVLIGFVNMIRGCCNN